VLTSVGRYQKFYATIRVKKYRDTQYYRDTWSCVPLIQLVASVIAVSVVFQLLFTPWERHSTTSWLIYWIVSQY